MNHHLVILKKHYLDRILARTKTVECRLSKTRHAPFRQVATGDHLWLKQSGGPIVATARAGIVRFLELNHPTTIAQLERRYAKRIQADSSFFTAHAEAQYASLIYLTHVRPCVAFSIEKKDRLAWVVYQQPPSAHPPRSDPPQYSKPAR